MKQLLLLIILLLSSNFYGQINPAKRNLSYYDYVVMADSLYRAKDYENSALAYSAAFKSIGGKGISHDRYNAACAWAKVGNADSAFAQLFHIVEKAFYKDYDKVVGEEDFELLHSDYRWDKLLMLIKESNDFNLGFERVNDFGALPEPWFKWGTGGYSFSLDPEQKHGGKYSMLIQKTKNVEAGSFGCIACAIPANYEGKEVEVKAFIRVKNTTQPIGLLLRIDSKIPNDILAFDNMMPQGYQGDDEWTEYSVKLPLPKEAGTIYIGAILSGHGKLWVDDFKVLIDGVDIKYARPKVVDNATDTVAKTRVQQLTDVFASKNFVVSVENDKGNGEYSFVKLEETWKMEYRYRVKNSDKPTQLVDEAKISSNDFNLLKQRLLTVVRYYFNTPDPFYTHYKITNGVYTVEFYCKYFDIWTKLRSNWRG